MNFETERLWLRPWQEADAPDLYEFAKDPRVGPSAGWPRHTSIENSREIIMGVLSKPDTYAIVPKCENRAVGCIGLKLGECSNLDIPEDEGEIGYWIGVPFWGQGLIPEAVNRMLCYGFEERRLTKIWCGYFKGNENSRRVQEKCGFRYHHTNENMPWPLMGDVRTIIISCLTLEQWKNDIRVIAEKR